MINRTFTLVFIISIILMTSILAFADTEVGGFISQDTLWTIDKSPYVVVRNIIVKESMTLSIEPGVMVKFKLGFNIAIDGGMIARGTKEKPITFTSFEKKEKDSWKGISFSTKSIPTKLDNSGNYTQGSILEYCIIEYAGVSSAASNLLINYCQISYSASSGISVSGNAIIINSTISNASSSYGGGIYISGSNSTCTITNNIISGNTASSYGGGIFIRGSNSTCTITNNTISGNTASEGGGIYIGSGTYTITNNTFTGNSAKSGAIYLGSVPAQFKNNAIYGNKAEYDIYYDVAKGKDMDATGNYWGTTNEQKIGMRIYDYFYDTNKGFVNFVPFLTSSPVSPSAPTELSRIPVDTSSIKLTWNANPETDIAGYKIYYDTDTGAPYEGKGLKDGDSPIDVKNVTTFTLSGLNPDKIYYLVVTAYYANGKESPYSNEVRSNTQPKTPSNIAPLANATDVPRPPALRCSEFSDSDTGDTHKSSQWQITVIAGNYTTTIFDSGTDTKNLTQITPSSKTFAPGATYYWHVRHQDSKGEWSEYSNETSFTTSLEKTTLKASMSLLPGINIISLPLKPDTSYTASSLANALGSTIAIRADNGKFDAYVPQTKTGTDFPIEMGKGYIVNLISAKTYEITGQAWGVSAAPSSKPADPWAFVVTGRITGTLPDGAVVRISNTRTGQAHTLIRSDGEFIGAFVDMTQQSVATAGDEITVQIVTKGDIPLMEVKNIISREQIANAYLLTNLNVMPEHNLLLQNYPNPFNPETWIPFQLTQDSQVEIIIYNINGHLVKRLDLGYRQVGWYLSKEQSAYWDGRNENGEKVSSGVYIYCLRTGNFTSQRKLVVLK